MSVHISGQTGFIFIFTVLGWPSAIFNFGNSTVIYNNLICHEGRECLDLVSTHVQGVPYASLAGTPVVGVLSPIPVDHLVGTIVSEERKFDLEHVSARLNDLEDAVCLLDLLLPGGPHSLHVLVDKYVLWEEAGFEKEVLWDIKQWPTAQTRHLTLGNLRGGIWKYWKETN